MEAQLNSKNILELKSLELLDTYSGANNYILKLKEKKQHNSGFYPTRSQSQYIIDYYNSIPKIAKKWVDLDPYFASKIADERLLIEIPKKLWVEKLLVEKDKAYHLWGKFNENDQLSEFWMPKAAIIKSPSVKKMSIDYSKYDIRPPLPHQKEGIELLAGSKRFILADDMGLGKTGTSIIAALETNAKKILIICPASLKINWEREIKIYTDRPTYIAEGKKISLDTDFLIVNYDILKNFYDIKNHNNSEILKFNPDLTIIDEAHFISNPQSKRTKIINNFVKKCNIVWLLTGTPVTNRPMNYFNLLQIIESPVAQNWMAYAIRYCNGYQFKVGNKKIWNVTGSSNIEELRDRTSFQILRRLKTDVLDLPEKIITPVYLRLKSKHYEDLMGEYYNWIDNKGEGFSSLSVQFSKLMKVRQVIANEKIDETISFIENVIDQDKKVIVFTNFTEPLQKIHSYFGKKSVYLDGSCNKIQRQDAVDRFQTDDKIMVFVGNLKAAGVGITLTSAEVVVMNDLSFVPSDHAQAEDRAYRYGQKSNVLVYYPIFENSIENIIYNMLASKKNIIDTIMGDNLDKGDFIEQLMNEINFKR